MTNKRTKRGKGHRFINPEELEDGIVGCPPDIESASDSASDSDSSGATKKEPKPSGVSHLIETHNPNRTGKPPNREDAPMNRKEREALRDPLSMKSELEMKQDMARLQLVRRQREEAERKALEEKKTKEAAKAAAQARALALLEAKQNKGKKGGHKPGAKIGKQKAATANAGCSSADASAGNSGAVSDAGSHN